MKVSLKMQLFLVQTFKKKFIYYAQMASKVRVDHLAHFTNDVCPNLGCVLFIWGKIYKNITFKLEGIVINNTIKNNLD